MMLGRLKWLCQWVVMVLIFAACSANLPVAPTPQPTSVPTATGAARPSSSPTSRPTRIVQPTETVTKRLVAIPPSPTPRFSSHKIELGEDFAETALWSDDGKTIYYAFRPRYSSDKVLNWAAYDVATHVTSAISSPLKYDPSIWKRLNVKAPDPSGWYPEIQGFVSPSGERVVYGVSYGSCSPITTCDPNNPNRIEIWRGDVATRKKTKVGEIPHGGGIAEIIWFDDETKVALNIALATADSYIADLQTNVITPLEQLANIRIVESIWCIGVSPDGKTLAANNGAELLLIDLDGKAVKIDKAANHAHWSKDGQTLYYGTNDGVTQEFRAYTPATGLTSALISQSKYDGPIGGDFAVSPDGLQIVFWGGWLQLVELSK